MTYFEWVILRAGRNSQIGSLADEIKDDLKFPVEIDDINELKYYLSSRGVNMQGIKVAERSFKQYKKEIELL